MQRLSYLDSDWARTGEVSLAETLHTLMTEIKLDICLHAYVRRLHV